MINLDRVLVYISSFFLSGFFEIQKSLIIISILPSTDVNIGCHVTFWRHNSTSVHRPGISSWTNAVNFKLTPGADWWHNHFGFVTQVYFIDQKVIFADINKNWKMMSSNNSLVLNRRLPLLIKVSQKFPNLEIVITTTPLNFGRNSIQHKLSRYILVLYRQNEKSLA